VIKFRVNLFTSYDTRNDKSETATIMCVYIRKSIFDLLGCLFKSWQKFPEFSHFLCTFLEIF